MIRINCDNWVVLQFRCIVLKPGRQHVSIHGYTVMEQCGKKFVSELSCRNHACRTTAEQRQLSLLASCRFQDKPIGNYLPQTPKRQTLAPTRSQNLISKMKQFLASPSETIEAASQKLKLKMWRYTSSKGEI